MGRADGAGRALSLVMLAAAAWWHHQHELRDDSMIHNTSWVRAFSSHFWWRCRDHVFRDAYEMWRRLLEAARLRIARPTLVWFWAS